MNDDIMIAGEVKRLPKMGERYYLKMQRPYTGEALRLLQEGLRQRNENPGAMLVLGDGMSIEALPDRHTLSPMGEALRLSGAGL